MSHADDFLRRDHQDVFKNPVSKHLVPDYFDIIKHPMCWSLIDEKLDRHEYWNANDLKVSLKIARALWRTDKAAE